MTAKSKQVYTGFLTMLGVQMTSGDPHVQANGVDLWTPQGDITIIGARCMSVINPLPNTALGDLGGAYVYSELSLVARQNEERSSILRAFLTLDPVETPTIGEHGLWGGGRDRMEAIMFPEGYGIDLDRWHPVYLNVGYRTFYTAGNIECSANGVIYYVERN